MFKNFPTLIIRLVFIKGTHTSLVAGEVLALKFVAA